MNSRIISCSLICALVSQVLFCLNPSHALADVVVNGGFETAGPNGIADSAEWAVTAGTAPTTVSERSLQNPHSGLAAHRLFTETQGDALNVVQFPGSLSSPAASLQPGDELFLKFWTDGTNITNNFVAFLTVNDSGSWQDSSLLIVSTDNVFGTYEMRDTSLTPIIIPDSVVGPITYTIDFTYSQAAPTGLPTEIWIDDVMLDVTSVPEPGCAVVGLMAFACLFRRIRKREIR